MKGAFRYDLDIFIVFICEWRGMHTPQHLCRVQRTAMWELILSTVWVLKIELRSSGWATSAFTS